MKPIEPGCLAIIIHSEYVPSNIGRSVRVICELSHNDPVRQFLREGKVWVIRSADEAMLDCVCAVTNKKLPMTSKILAEDRVLIRIDDPDFREPNNTVENISSEEKIV